MILQPKQSLFGSCLSKTNIRPSNAYGWKFQLHKNSLVNKLLRLMGLPHLGSRIRNKIVMEELKKMDGKQYRVLDAGCGIGLTGFLLAEKGHKVTGIDIDSGKIKQAKQIKKENNYKNIDFLNKDLLRIKNNKEKFDIIICLEVIEHVHSDKELLKVFAKLLKKDGFIIISFPSPGFLSKIAQKSLDHFHVGYKPDDIRKILSKKNLYISEEKSFGNTVLGKSVIALDFLFRKTLPILSGIFFPIFYPIVVFDYYLPSLSCPRGYVLVISKS